MSTVTEKLALTTDRRKLQLPQLGKQIQCLLDLLVLSSAFLISYLLRFDFGIPDIELHFAAAQLIYVVMIQFTAMLLNGVYSFIWRYVGLTEAKQFALTLMWAAIPLVVLRIGLSGQFQMLRVPLSVILIDTTLAFGGVLGLRVLRRVMHESQHKKSTYSQIMMKKPILLIGAGLAGVLTIKEIKGRGDIDLDVKGFVDDDNLKRGSVIHGVKVLGTMEDLPRLVEVLKIDHVVISIAQASRQQFRRLIDICEAVPVRVRVIPGLYELLQSKLQVSRIRDLQVEDLLGRDPVQLDEESMNKFLTGKTVMVTGAGGSIGSELARQVAKFNPSNLLLIERSENALFNIEREMQSEHPQITLLPLIGDVGDEPRMRTIFRDYRPELVIHAAAHKHVPMMEINASEALKNNVLGTQLLGALAGEYGAQAFVLISSDKAVRPTSVMGASKRVAELVIQDLDAKYATRFLAVRFGNVIGSAGSVIPIFRGQIQKGGPVTVTHRDMKRYFMTIPEAAQLVLQAGAIGEGGEIFILDMGEPVSILELAKETIRLSGLKPFEDIDIVFTGTRPGEKMNEELDTTDEQLIRTRHPKIFIGNITSYQPEQIRHSLDQIESLAQRSCEGNEVREFLNRLLPEAQLECDKVVDSCDSPLLHASPLLTIKTVGA